MVRSRLQFSPGECVVLRRVDSIVRDSYTEREREKVWNEKENGKNCRLRGKAAASIELARVVLSRAAATLPRASRRGVCGDRWWWWRWCVCTRARARSRVCTCARRERGRERRERASPRAKGKEGIIHRCAREVVAGSVAVASGEREWCTEVVWRCRVVVDGG